MQSVNEINGWKMRVVIDKGFHLTVATATDVVLFLNYCLVHFPGHWCRKGQILCDKLSIARWH